MNTAPKTLSEALNVIRAMNTALLSFRNPEFDLIALGREGDFDDRVKAVLAHSAPVIKADRELREATREYPNLPPAHTVVTPRSSEPYGLFTARQMIGYAQAAIAKEQAK